MENDTEALLQTIFACCAQEAQDCLANRKNKSVEYRAIEVRMAASMAHASARLADSLRRLQKQTPNRGSNGSAA